MKHIIASIRVALHLDNSKDSHVHECAQQDVECNYANNYYGDQQCRLKNIEQ